MLFSRLLHSIFHPSFVGSAHHPTTKAFHIFAKCKFAFSNYKFQQEIYKFVYINFVQKQQVKYSTILFNKRLPGSEIKMAKVGKPLEEKKSVEKIHEEAVVSSSTGFIIGEDETVTSSKGKGRGRKTKKDLNAEVKPVPAQNGVKPPVKNSENGRGRKKQTNGEEGNVLEAEAAESESADVVTAPPVEKKAAVKGRGKKTVDVVAQADALSAEVVAPLPLEKKSGAKGRGKKAEIAVVEAEATPAEDVTAPPQEKKSTAKGRGKKAEPVVAETATAEVVTAIPGEKKNPVKGRSKKAETAVAEVVAAPPAEKKPPAKGRGKKASAVVAVASEPVVEESANAENDLPKVSTKRAAKAAAAVKVEELAVENGGDVVTAVAPAAKGRGRGKKNTAAASAPVEENVAAVEPVRKQRAPKKGTKEIPNKEENQNGENAEETVKETKKRGGKVAQAQPVQLKVNGNSEEAQLDVKSPKSRAKLVKEEPEGNEIDTPFEKPTTAKSSKAKAGTKRKVNNEEAVKAVDTNELEVKVEEEEEVKPSPKKNAKKEPKGKKPKEAKATAKSVETLELDTVAQLEKPKENKSRSRKAKTPEVDAASQLENVVLEKGNKAQGRKRAAAAVDADDKDDADGAKPAKAKKTGGKLMNATETKYNKEDFILQPGENGEERFNLKISSWNVAGLRSWLNKDGLRFLEYELPDIFCLQEIKCTTEQMPEEVARIPGYHPYWLCMPGGYAGVAIYSKIMPINVEYGIGNEEFDAVGRMITAEYEKFFLINVYVPNSGRKLVNLEARMRWEKLFQEYVKRLDAKKAVVVCGDMNVSHQAIDLANPKTNTRSAGFTQEERDKMTELLGLGFVDTFRHLYPDRTAAYTYWTYMANARSRNVGWRLDYFIVSERFTKRVIDNCIRSQVLGSDHCPITLFLKM